MRHPAGHPWPRIATKQQFQLSSQDALEAKKNADSWLQIPVRSCHQEPLPWALISQCKHRAAEDHVAGLNREVLRRQDRLLLEQHKEDHVKAARPALDHDSIGPCMERMGFFERRF